MQHRWWMPRIPVVTIVVINDGITINFHPIEIAINIAVVSIAIIVIRSWRDDVVAQHLQLPVQHPAEHDGVQMVVEWHAHIGGEDEYPRRVLRGERPNSARACATRSAGSVPPIAKMEEGQEGAITASQHFLMPKDPLYSHSTILHTENYSEGFSTIPT